MFMQLMYVAPAFSSLQQISTRQVLEKLEPLPDLAEVVVVVVVGGGGEGWLPLVIRYVRGDRS